MLHRRVDWMVAADDAVLRLIDRTKIALTPNVLAHNLGYNPDYLATRCRKLHRRSLLTKTGNGGPFYTLAPLGEDYVTGNITVEELEALSEDGENGEESSEDEG